MSSLHKRIGYGAVAVVLLGLLLWPKLSSDGSAPERGRQGPSEAAVTAYVAEPVTMRDRIRATGSLQADERVDLTPEASGRVTQILFEEGTPVRKGQLLLTINDAELRAQRERLRHQVELAATREKRQERLLEIGGASQDEYDAAQAQLNVLRSELGLVEAQIEKTQVRAPFSGVIGLRYVSEGAYVSPQTRVASLQRLSPMKVEFSVPERYANRIDVGDEVVFRTSGASLPSRGTVYAVEPRVNLDTRAVQIRARVPNPSGDLLPGAFADIELLMDEIDDAVPVPAISVISDMGGKRVWVVEDGKAKRQPIETGIRTEEAVQITSGVAPGDTVITSGLQTIRTGQSVRITDVRALGAERNAEPLVSSGTQTDSAR